MPPLPRLPDPRLDGAVASGLAEQSAFLQIERLCLTVSGSTPFNYDVVTRKALDAVVIAAHFRVGGKVEVMLRSAVRPPVWWRERGSPVVWELPAGLVEPNELPREAALRELFEEVGARVEPTTLQPLGPPMLAAPGMIAEVQTFFHVVIDPRALTVPEGDSSALENASTLYACPLDEALALCASGAIRDLKTELGLRRLAEVDE